TGVISGNGTLTKLGAGTLFLTAANTYFSGTNVNAGTLNFNSLSALGPGPIGFGGGTLQWSAGNTTDISVRAVTVGSGGATLDVAANNLTFTNAIGNNGIGSLTKVGSGTLILNGSNTYTGGTVVSAGTLQIGNASTTASIIGDVLDNAVLAFNRSNAITYSGVVSGTGS